MVCGCWVSIRVAVQGAGSAVWRATQASRNTAMRPEAARRAHTPFRKPLYITACNPYGKILTDADNVQRQAVFAQELRQRSLIFLTGIGAHPNENWPGEPSYLILGLSLEAAREMGVTHEQNAIVWCGANAVPDLILLR